jgi:hypothetical protein
MNKVSTILSLYREPTAACPNNEHVLPTRIKLRIDKDELQTVACKIERFEPPSIRERTDIEDPRDAWKHTDMDPPH